jgi:hypothetical protein
MTHDTCPESLEEEGLGGSDKGPSNYFLYGMDHGMDGLWIPQVF